MKLCVLAVDFDGTIAAADVMDPDVRGALAGLRAQGVVVLVATGRILEDLENVAGDLHFADAVVAENGSVVAFPDSGYSTIIGRPPPDAFLAALRQAGVAFQAGRVVVECDARDATRILDIVRKLELPLALAFNRGRLMILPQTISKATGVRQALTILRLSPHNAVAIGDAENDHELLQACEVGVAVEWGSPALQASADYVLPGSGPRAVAGYIRSLAERPQVPVPLRTRRRLILGHSDDGRPLSLAVRGRNVLVAGDAKSGKSWVTGLLCEQLILYGYSLCVLDPEGDYLSLEALPGVVVFGGADPLPRPRDLMRALRHADVSVVIDLSRVSQLEKIAYLTNVLPMLATLRRQTGLPHRIVVDEAHYFLHHAGASALLDLDANGYTLVSYRASRLPADVLAATEAVVVTRESDPHEVDALFALCQSCAGHRSASEWRRLFGALEIGEAIILPVTEEAEGEIRHIRLIPRLTPHVRHLAKYIDVPVMASHAFVFWRDGAPTEYRAQTLRDFVTVLETTSFAWTGHLNRGDFSRWIEGVFGDYPLAATVRAIEAHARATGGRGTSASGAVAQAVRSRYDFLEPQPSTEEARIR